MSLAKHLRKTVSQQIPVFWHHPQSPVHGLYFAGEFEACEFAIADPAFVDLIAGLAERHGTVVVHGHIRAALWRRASFPGDIEFMTWLRDPVARLRSHFDYWRLVSKATPRSAEMQELKNRVIDGSCSLTEFSQHQNIQNIAVRFLAPLGVDDLSLVGLLEHSAASLERLHDFLGIEAEIDLPKVNVTASPSTAKSSTITPEIRASIEASSSRDMDLYRRAVELFLA